jgi:hypothetical protein
VIVFVLVQLDDIIVTTLEFAMKDLLFLSFFLGIQAFRNQHGLHLNQQKYVTNLLHLTKMAGAKPASTSCAPTGK